MRHICLYTLDPDFHFVRTYGCTGGSTRGSTRGPRGPKKFHRHRYHATTTTTTWKNWLLFDFLLLSITRLCCCTECPADKPNVGSPCSQITECSYGEECCCGQCHPRWVSSVTLGCPWISRPFRKLVSHPCSSSSMSMMCEEGKWVIGLFTDACLRPDCENTTG